MKNKLREIGIKDESFQVFTVAELIKKGIIEKPLDGNHGEIHPKGSDFVETGVPFIMASDINNGLIDYVGCKFISEKQADSLQKGFAKNGDVLLTHKASIGRTAIVSFFDHPYVMLTPQVTYYRVKDNEKLNNHYLRYYFDGDLFQKTLFMWASSGGTRAYIGITAQQKLPVILPPIEKQKRIAEILTAYDDLIETNNQRIATLEQLAQQIYKAWFVRMRFPGWESTHFYHGVPDGWCVSELLDFGKVITGKTPSTLAQSNFGGDFPFIKTPDMHQNIFIFHTNESLTIKGVETQINQKVPAGSICTSCIGSAGVVSITTRESMTNQQINSLIVKDEIFREYLFFAIKFLKPTIELFGSTGATMTNLSKGKFERLKIFNPSYALIKDFNGVIFPMFEEIKILTEQNQNLCKTRNLLLPGLFNAKFLGSLKHDPNSGHCRIKLNLYSQSY